jgi:hypothetical protein
LAPIAGAGTVSLPAVDASYGLGNYGDVLGGATARGHGGGLPGFRSAAFYLPQHGVGFVLLLNSSASGRALQEIHRELVAYLLRDLPRRPPPVLPVPEEELRRWAGNYHFASPRHQLFAFLHRTEPAITVAVDGGRLYVVPGSGRRVELVPTGGDRFRVPRASGSHLVFARDAEGRRLLVDHGNHFVEEPRWRSRLFHRLPPICLWILASGLLLPLGVIGARARPVLGFGWPLAASLSFFAAAHGFLMAFGSDPATINQHTLLLFFGTLGFAVASAGTAWQALVWVHRRAAPPLALAYRLAFAAAACTTTAYLAAYGLIGIRLWAY